jgi:hypothetical protein
MRHKITRHLAQVVVAAVAFGAFGAKAGTVTIGFEDGPFGSTGAPFGPTSGTNNFSTQGFVFSPGCHHDWVPTPAYVSGRGGHWLGFDISGCGGSPGSIGFNTDYLGPGGPVVQRGSMFVRHLWGETFTAESFVFATFLSAGMTVTSSKGGSLRVDSPDAPWSTIHFAGDEWRDISWLVFDTGSSGVPVGFDDLVVSGAAIPSPSTLFLALPALLLGGWLQRRQLRP